MPSPQHAVVRPYVPDDVDQVVDIWYRASLVGHPFLNEDFLTRERRQIAEQWLPASETHVYERGGHVVGFVSLVGNEVGGLFVDPDHHRTGVGRALLDVARAGRPHLELAVFEANPGGRRFYAAYGFVEIGRGVDEASGHPELRLRLG